MSGKHALIIGNTEYIDSGLAQLSAPGRDTEDFARVLKDPDLCAFGEVKVLLNQISSSAIEAIDEFFDRRKPDDLLVLYFSGHGVRDEFGSLYLAFPNTIRSRLRSTAIKAEYIREAMDSSRSKRQVLILDCCNSGAFPQGTKAEVGGTMGLTRAFQGSGRLVLTASDATQFAWEGERVIGETQNSLFTHFLLQGLKGEADRDGDGFITADELYDYAYEQVSKVTPKQTPTKSASRQEGEIVLRHITRLEDIKPVTLPADLLEAIDDTRTFVREGAVQELEKLLKGRNLGLARSAREALERIERADDSRRVSQAATQVLEAVRRAETPIATEEHEEAHLIPETADTARRAEEEVAELVEPEKIEIAPRQLEEETSSETVVVTQPASPVIQRQSIMRWAVIGTIGLCILAGVALRPYIASLLAPATPVATEPLLTESPTTQVPATEAPTESPVLVDSLGLVSEEVLAGALEEGALNVIALPSDWCNFGEIINTFERTYSIQVNRLLPDASSNRQLDVLRDSKEEIGPESPDVIDIGFIYAEIAKTEGLLLPYKVSTWDDIPMEAKHADGFWYGGYMGVTSFLVNTDVQPNIPRTWEDLLNPIYKNQVALSGDPPDSTEAALSVYAASLASGTFPEDPQAGLDFFVELNTLGNLIPWLADDDLVENGQIPISIGWDHELLLMQQDVDDTAGTVIVIPSDAQFVYPYIQAISAYGQHPNAAKLWMEFLYSDEGQLLLAEGLCRPIREKELRARNVIPNVLAEKFPEVTSPLYTTIDHIRTGRDFIMDNWDSVVGVDIDPAP